MALEHNLKYLLEPNLGTAKDTYQGMKFNCPKPGCDQGNKYNLEICLNQNDEFYLIFHCWACHYKGHISFLLKDYAVNDSWKAIKELQTVSSSTQKKDKKDDRQLNLPANSIPFYLNKDVERYLIHTRKIPKEILLERKVQYVFGDGWLSNHIIFPFYDIFGEELIGMCVQDFSTKKYKNIGRLNYVPYINFINQDWPITLSEGVYDVLSVVNGIPLLGTDIPEEILKFLFDKQVILALDREVDENDKLEKASALSYYGCKEIIIFSNPYKDLNEFRIQDKKSLIEKYNSLFSALNKIKNKNNALPQ